VRRPPRRASAAISSALARSFPGTPLAAVQQLWAEAVGDSVAAQAEPVGEREGTVTISCKTATWAQELDLMQTEIQRRLNRELAARYPDSFQVKALRFTADAARHQGA
jgi:predicted nucleic acid-binding Zn ribbon protein